MREEILSIEWKVLGDDLGVDIQGTAVGDGTERIEWLLAKLAASVFEIDVEGGSDDAFSAMPDGSLVLMAKWWRDGAGIVSNLFTPEDMPIPSPRLVLASLLGVRKEIVRLRTVPDIVPPEWTE